MRLADLLDRLPHATIPPDLPDAEVLGVQEDSRRINTGDLFVARRGHGADGKQFVADAHRAGAVAVVSDEPIDGAPLPVVVVKHATAAASMLANAVAGDPSRSMKVLGVTGTNGKTTTTFLLRHILRHLGKRCGLIGTCEVDDGTRSRPAAMTTPGPVTLAEILASMRDKGCDAIAMEASSHALDQGRCAGVTFAAGGFTNLSGDHLDYHRTMDEYAAAKSRLFRSLSDHAPAVVNNDDAYAERMLQHSGGRAITFSVGGANGDADYVARDILTAADGNRFVLKTPDGVAAVRMSLVGRHNVQNALCAAAMAGETFGLSVHQLAAALADAPSAPGRLERVDAGQPFSIVVDYAHTDDALDNVLRALRPITKGRLRVVFGCGGDRDRAKRPRMAAVAERGADDLYITSDNPRSEDPQRILDDVVAGLSNGSARLVDPDRRTAIRQAVADCGSSDTLLIAGKGHENYQIVGDQRLSFDDVDEARRAASELQGTPAA